MLFLVCRPSSSLGLEQPGDAVDALAPELEKVVDEVVVDVAPTTVATVEPSVPP